MYIEAVSEENLVKAAYIHATAWRESHRNICSEAFVAEHTTQRQTDYLRHAIHQGKRFFMLTDDVPVAVVSIDGSIIADLYVHPDHPRRGYGTKILEYAMSQCDSYPILWVLNTNQGAQRLYERLGFQKSGKFKELKNGLFEIEMVCKKG